MDANHIGKLEQGVICWPAAPIRAGLRAVLGVTTDRELGLHSTRQPPVAAPTAAPPKPSQPAAIGILPLATGILPATSPPTVIGPPTTVVSLTVTTDPAGTVRIIIQTAPPEVAAPGEHAEAEAAGARVVPFQRTRQPTAAVRTARP